MLFNNLSSILFWSNLKLLLLQHYSIHILIFFLFFPNYSWYTHSAELWQLLWLCSYTSLSLTQWHNLLSHNTIQWGLDLWSYNTSQFIVHNCWGTHSYHGTPQHKIHSNKYERLQWKRAFADTRAATIISHNNQNESVCLANKGKKSTVKRWIGKCLHQCNLEIENRDWQSSFTGNISSIQRWLNMSWSFRC